MKKVLALLVIVAIAAAAFFFWNSKNKNNAANTNGEETQATSVLPEQSENVVSQDSVSGNDSDLPGEDATESAPASDEDLPDSNKPVSLNYVSSNDDDYSDIKLPDDLLPVRLSGMALLFPYDKDIPFRYCALMVDSYVKQYMEKNLSRNILVEGDACTYGTEAHNLDLSRRRAEYLKNELVKRGIPAERIKIKYYGSKRFGKMGFGLRPHHRRASASLM